MGFERAVPKNVGELKENFANLFKNKSHVKKVEVNAKNSHLEVTLDMMAHIKVSDFYLPLKTTKIADATKLVAAMMTAMDKGFVPSDAQIQQLYDMIDSATK